MVTAFAIAAIYDSYPKDWTLVNNGVFEAHQHLASRKLMT